MSNQLLAHVCSRTEVIHLGGQEFGQVLVESVAEHGVCDDADLFKVG